MHEFSLIRAMAIDSLAFFPVILYKKPADTVTETPGILH